MLLDYELMGDLQISNGIVSGFNNSTNNYIKIPYGLPMGNNKVEACISVYIPAFTSGSVILTNYNDSASGGGLGLRTDGRYDDIYYWAWDSSGTLIADRIDLGFDLTIGTNIIKFVYENSTITWYKSTDGTNFTQGVSQSGTIADFQNYLAIGASGTVWSSGNMQVNMLDSYIKLNDEYWHSKEYIKQKTKIIQRHDTATNWSTVNPILALGEMGVETDTNKFKFGNGTTSYNELPYAAGEGGGTGGSGTTITSKDSTISYNKLALGDGLVADIGDIPWTNPQMSSNSQDGYVLTSSSNNTSDGKSNMYKAFDKDTTIPDDCWYTGSVSMPQWIMLECPEPVRLTSCMIMNEILTPVNFKSGYIQGSNDGSNFDTLYTITDRPDTTGLQVTYTFDNSKYYKYLRVYCTASHGSGLSIQEIEFSGYVKSKTAVPTLNAKVDAYTKKDTDDLLNTKQDKLTAGDGIEIKYKGTLTKEIHPYNNGNIDLNITYPENEVVVNTQTTLFKNPADMVTKDYTIIYKPILPISDEVHICLGRDYRNYESINQYVFNTNSTLIIGTSYNGGNGDWYINDETQRNAFIAKLNAGKIVLKFTRKLSGTTVTKEIQISDDDGSTYHPASYFGYSSDAIIVTNNTGDRDSIFSEYTFVFAYSNITLDMSGIEMVIGDGSPVLTISGQDVKTFTGYSDTGTLVLKSINGVLQWVAEA